MASSQGGGERGSLSGGRAVQIVEIASDGANERSSFTLNKEALAGILCSPEHRELPVVVVSIAGPFRLGKSFLLNFLLRYLEHEGKEGGDWVEDGGDIDPEAAGFGWKNDAERHTTGIWMSPKPIIRHLPDGRKVGLLLVDTQGTFDNQTTAEVNAMVFALNSLLSSFQVYNISKRIGEDVLQHMHLFTKFAQMVGTNQTGGGTELKAFQSLMFLIRDWGSSREFGLEGGTKHLEDVLEAGHSTAESEAGGESGARELLEVRQDIKSCFEQISCFLLPHPGFEVAEGYSDETGPYKGDVSMIRKPFKDRLRDLAPLVLRPENLAVKRVLGEEVTCGGLFTYMQEWVGCFANGELPEVRTVFEATAIVNHRNVRDKAKAWYDERAAKFTGAGAPFMEPEKLKEELSRLQDEAKKMYADAPKLAAPQVEADTVAELDAEMEKLYEEALAVNSDKSIFKMVRTPVTLLGLQFIFSVAATLLGLVLPDAIASVFSWISWVFFLMLATSMYCKQTGNIKEVGVAIDQFAAEVADWVVKEITTRLTAAAMHGELGDKKDK